MILTEDTRQQKSKHLNIHNYCKRAGIEIVSKCLSVGDYMLAGNDTVSVDTKQDLTELACDLQADEKALNKKYRKCYEQKIMLIVLIEDGAYSCTADIAKWRNPYGKVSGWQLMQKVHRLEVSYGIKFRFCSKEKTGETLIKLLSNKCNIQQV